MKVSLPHQQQQQKIQPTEIMILSNEHSFFQFHVSETISNGEIDIHDILNFF